MDDELKPTLFDEQLQSKELQILKTSIPYLQEPQLKNLAIFGIFVELQKTIHLFVNMSEEERKKTDMILSLMKNMKRR